MDHELKPILQKLSLCRDIESLKTTFAMIPADTSQLLKYIRFDAESYTRNRVIRTDKFEILVLCWKAGQESKIHNHEDSTCMFMVVEGELTDTHFVRNSDQLISISVNELSYGQRSLLFGENYYHKISNNSNVDAVSIHLYSPPLGEYQIIDNEFVEDWQTEVIV
ncbi:MAG: cysteine dioxygenase family protein [Oceanospirillaceae bacterium]|nr:cysteine dioxygenase family protein [Oceanospirillaceae bacterium]